MNRYRLLALLLFAPLALGSAFATSPEAGRATSLQLVPEAIQALTATTDEDGRLWAVWEAETGIDVDLAYSRWDGKEWSSPLPVHRRPDAWDRSPSLTIAADGTPWLAWASSRPCTRKPPIL